jgi:PAS domain S-box-containing protein
MLALSSWTGGAPLDEREMELLRAIRALLSQGIVLYRTILDLMRVEAYNENILNSLNDMGDTLIILDLEGRVRMANRAACKLLEFTEAELAGGAMSGLVGEDGGFFTEEGFLELARGGSVSNREIYYRSKSGREIPVLLSASAMTGEDGRTREVVLVARDITEHRKAEEAAKSALLIQEIHHRIKNNLQVISSLLFLQASYVDDERIREMFRDSQNRVRSMALIHEKLYKSRRPSAIDFSEYIGDLARNLFTSYKLKPANVTLSIDGSDISLGMDTAVPCGLIVNELVSNSLKHAFPDGRSGEIRIALRRIPPGIRPGTEVWYDLSVSDDGIGFPEGTDFGSFGSMGLKVVSSLTHQLHGEIEAAGGRGTEFRIRFKEV